MYAVLAVLLVGVLVAVVVLRISVPGVEDASTTESFRPLPRGGVDPDDVLDVRFDPAVRGYRMAQVDGVLERLVDEIRLRDAEIARLRGEARDPGPENETEHDHHHDQEHELAHEQEPARAAEEVSDRGHH